jgi:hypothetical protein
MFLVLVLAGYLVILLGVVGLNRRAIRSCRLQGPVNSIVIGDSHTMWAIDDREIPGVRNISLNAEGYKYSYLKLRHLLETEKGIEKIYIGFAYHNLAGYYDDYITGPIFDEYVGRYLSVLSLGDYLELAEARPWGFPELTRRMVKEGWRAGLRGRCELYGTFPEEHMTQTFDLASAKKRIVSQFYAGGKVVGRSDSNYEYLQKLVDLSRQFGLEVIMLSTPLHPEYEKSVPEEYRQAYQDFIRKNGLSVYRFEDLELGDEDFLPDGDHTNRRGAARTTKRFKEYDAAH